MGSKPPRKRQRLAPSPATPSGAASRPIAGITTSSLPQPLEMNQSLFRCELQGHERLCPAESKPTAPPDPLLPPAPAPLGLEPMRRVHGHDPRAYIDKGNQCYHQGPVTPADSVSYSSGYFFGMGHMSTSPEPTTTTHAPNASLALSFQAPDQIPTYPDYTDPQLLHSSFHKDLPVFTSPNDAHPLMPSTPLSARSSEEKQEGLFSEQALNIARGSERTRKRRSTKASQVN